MYLKKTIIYGNRIETLKYHTSRFGIQGERRHSRQKPTEESVAKANERNAERKLYRLLVGNFDESDWFLTLTYKRELRPDPEGSRKLLRKFMAKMRKAYQAAGQDLKYIITTEWNGKAIHHHIVINDIPGFNKLVSKYWIHGGMNMRPLYQDHDYIGLAEYMIKETRETFRDKENPYRQRYTCSRNLKKPVEKVEIIRSGSWRETPAVPDALRKEGYILDIDSVVTGVDVFGYPYQQYSFVKRD